jgi:hypothetical protein
MEEILGGGTLKALNPGENRSAGPDDGIFYRDRTNGRINPAL